MYQSKALLFILISTVSITSTQASSEIDRSSRNIFDNDLYEEALNPILCNEQLQFLANDSITILQFYDAGIRIPRGIFLGNLADWGNYHQCLAISHPIEGSVVEGKYCSIQASIGEDFINLPELPSLPDIVIPENMMTDEKTQEDLKYYNQIKYQIEVITGTASQSSRIAADVSTLSFALNLGICIPKVCSTKQVYDFILGNQSTINVEYSENFCRLPNDKPFSPADYVAIVLFSIIGLIIIASTTYDLHHTVLLKKEPKEINKLCSSFSVYTNTRRLLTFNSSADALHCIDGIRAISMLWVIVGHTFSTSLGGIANNLHILDWMTSIKSIWVTSAPITVDTFFMMSGLLIVYTTAEKLSKSKFVKSIHLFYILRYLRLFPLLAAAVLFQASVIHHMSDGPNWGTVAQQVENCRQNWWITLLYVQNYVDTFNMCLPQTWYLAVDMQLYWISPLVLYWVLSDRRRVAWLALALGLLLALVAGTTYSFLNNFPSSVTSVSRFIELIDYMKYYYVNTLTRASPFFVGMVFGYIMHLCRSRKTKLAPVLVLFFWTLTAITSAFVIFITYPLSQRNYDNQLLDNFLNSFIRPLWAAALGWLIFACVHGHGGPVNWFLSLNMWKLPARLSYAMYLFHYPLMYMFQGSLLSPIYFTVSGTVYRFLADLVLTVLVSFIMTLAVDSPFSTLQKLLLGGGRKPLPREEKIDHIHGAPGTPTTIPNYVDLEAKTVL